MKKEKQLKDIYDDFLEFLIRKLVQYEDFTIKKYLESNSLTGFTKTTTGLYYKIGQPGTGSPITTDSTIVANYTGKLLNGAILP